MKTLKSFKTLILQDGNVCERTMQLGDVAKIGFIADYRFYGEPAHIINIKSNNNGEIKITVKTRDSGVKFVCNANGIVETKNSDWHLYVFFEPMSNLDKYQIID